MSIHTRSEIRAEIRRMIKDTSTSTTQNRWTDAQLNSRVDWAQEDICTRTSALRSRITSDITSGTAEYTLPNDYLSAEEVLYKDSDGDWQRLQQASERELDLSDPEWRSDDGTPSHYYIRRNLIGLYPNPDTTRTSALRVDYIERPDDITSDSTVVMNGVYQLYAFHDLIVLLVAARCKEDESEYDKANYLYAKFFAGIKDMRARLGERNKEDLRIINIYETVRAKPRRTR